MILGLLPATSGEASIGGFRSGTHPDEVKRRVGLVSAYAGVYQWLTVRESLEFFADLYGVPRPQAHAEMQRLSELLGLAEFLNQRCSTLSTGQRQRMQLARALIHQPPVMLLDEPTVGIDVLGSQVVTEYVAHLRDRGKAVILSTHRMEEAERLCDRLALMHKGRLVAQGTLDELKQATGCANLVEMFLKLSHTGPLLGQREGRSDR
jgi:ABC-2 type transport system ATP-binding protein/sodium transport system ATP-binding protein